MVPEMQKARPALPISLSTGFETPFELGRFLMPNKHSSKWTVRRFIRILKMVLGLVSAILGIIERLKDLIL
jgi:hypothetical protein